MPLAGALAGFAVFSATRLIVPMSIGEQNHRERFQASGLVPVLISSLLAVLFITMNALLLAVVSLEDLVAAGALLPACLAVIWGSVALAMIPMVRIAVIETRTRTRSSRSVEEWRCKWWFPNLLPLSASFFIVLLFVQVASHFAWGANWLSWFTLVFVSPLIVAVVFAAVILYASGHGRLRRNQYNRSGSMLLVMDLKGNVLLEKQESGTFKGKFTLPRAEDPMEVNGDSRPTADKALHELIELLSSSTGQDARSVEAEFPAKLSSRIVSGRKARLFEYFHHINAEARPASTVYEVSFPHSIRTDPHSYRVDRSQGLFANVNSPLLKWVPTDNSTMFDESIPLHVRDLIAGLGNCERDDKPKYHFWEIDEPFHGIGCTVWNRPTAIHRWLNRLSEM